MGLFYCEKIIRGLINNSFMDHNANLNVLGEMQSWEVSKAERSQVSIETGPPRFAFKIYNEIHKINMICFIHVSFIQIASS